ncbi:Asp domain protein [Rhizoctonia solani]|uniref:Asp domain protein n=1 Tax=Rhizoctonia solani TaxID=456999 RepID=A0A8H8P7D3_9AGAM|nr:Asp domain protein [Rhizoctonia solani]QRW26540.1 Asp domain protein [Rhizoctonia solani]
MPELGNEKRPQISESEWHSDDLLLERSRASSEPSAGYKSEAGSSGGSTVEKIPRLWVPRDLRYPSGKCIPFMLSLPTARADSGSDIESGIEVQLVRVSTIQTRAGVVQQASTVSRGRIQPSRDQGRTRTLRGTIDTGSAGKHLSWNFESLISNAYEVRATINSSTAGLVWRLIKGVELTTHEWSGERAGRIPSIDSPVTSRTGAHIVRVNF